MRDSGLVIFQSKIKLVLSELLQVWLSISSDSHYPSPSHKSAMHGQYSAQTFGSYTFPRKYGFKEQSVLSFLTEIFIKHLI